MTIEHVTKRYADRTALNDICVELKEGTITAVLGESGAGKTTLLNVISSLVSYEGTIDAAGGNPPVRRKGCSYLLQDACLLPNLTAEDNLKLVLPKTEWKKIGDIFERVGMQGKEKSYPGQLSGGEKQRVAIARAFLYPHDLLLMDEPFSSLDLNLKKSLMELILTLWKEKGESVIFVTHDVHEAVVLSHRALVLKKGKFVFDLPIASCFPRDFFGAFPEETALIRALTLS